MHARRSDIGFLLLFSLCLAALVSGALRASTSHLVSHRQSYAAAATEPSDRDDGAHGSAVLFSDRVVVTTSRDLGKISLLQLSLHRSDQRRIPVRHLKLGSPPDDPFSVI
jgi:hypothetical protein